MKESLLRQAAKLKQKNHDHKRWQKAVSILACVVVFCTVYALILPAVTMEKTAYCGKEEHTHTEECYEKKLICGKEEGEGAHQHSDDCYREEQVLVCTTPESDGHQHTDACYTEEPVLTCTNTDPDHVHSESDGCYTLERKLTCGQQEGEGAHHHTAECYETQKVLVCGQEENDGHHHTEDCYKKELVCQKEEHTHTLECYSNPDADVETEEQWSRAFANVTLTGDWAKDLTAIAETQTGYTESDRNYTVNADNTTNGYTRYGQWAGMPYADWSATFTSFCLYYANVPESAVPRNTGCEGWNSSAVSPNGYNPKEGDIILLDGNQDGITEHAGIVTSGSADNVTAIVGDSDKAVRRNTYSTSNAIITGYVSMPQNPALAEDEPEETPTPEVTEEPEPTATPTPEITEEPEVTPTPEVTEEPEPTATPTPEITEEPEVTATPTPEVTEEPELTVTPTPEVTEEPEPTATPTPEITEKPEPTETPEVTPTPEITKAPELTESQLTVATYTDSSYSTEMENETPITISGQLPVNAVVKAYPVENITMEDEEILYAWDISIFDEEGNLWEPEEGNAISVEFQIPEEAKEDSSYSIYYVPETGAEQKPEEVASQVSGDAISFEANHFSIYALTRKIRSAETLGLDGASYVSGFKLQKRNGDVWEDAHEFTTKDQVHAKFEFKNIPTESLKNNGNKVYIELPEGIDCSYFAGNKYDMHDPEYNDGISGHYKYEQVNGKWVVVIEFEEGYINFEDTEGTKGEVDAQIEFNYFWDSEKFTEEGKDEVIQVGEKTWEIKVKKDTSTEPVERKDNYSLKKEASKLSYDADGTAYIDYTISLEVKNDVTGPIEIRDILTGNGFVYDDTSLKIQPDVSPLDFKTIDPPEQKGSLEKQILIGDSDTTISKGKYTITYRVKNTKIGSTDYTQGTEVENTIKLEDVTKEQIDSTKTSVKNTVIKKNGSVSKNQKNVIDWVVEVNNGSAIANLKEDVIFKDTIQEGQTLKGRIRIKQFDPQGKQIHDWYETVEGNEIQCTLPKGQYYYVITYQTEVDSVPIGGTVVSNTGTVEGGLNGSDSANVPVSNPVLKKEAVGAPDISGTTVTLKWKSTIEIGNLDGYTYKDFSSTINDERLQSITASQLASMKIFDKNNNDISEKLRNANAISKLDGLDDEGHYGLFQIAFGNLGIQGPVRIEYETSVDFAKIPENSWVGIPNYALVSGNGESDKSNASQSVHYIKNNDNRMYKYGTGGSDGSYSGSTTLKPGEPVKWTIVLNKNGGSQPLRGNLTVEDIIPAGLILDESTIKLVTNDSKTYTVDSGGITISVKTTKNSDGTTTLIVQIPEECYKLSDSSYQQTTLTYDTILDSDSEFCKGDVVTKDFVNKASVKDNNGTSGWEFTEKVTRTVVGKTGSYNQASNLLNYSVVINPEGAMLNKGKDLTVEDILTVNNGKDTIYKRIKLDSVALFTAVKDSDGNFVASEFIRNLTQSETATRDTYVYRKDDAGLAHIFETRVEDGKAYVLVCQYEVNASDLAEGTYPVTNKVRLIGTDRWEAEDSSTKINKSTSGSSNIDYNKNRITVVKYSTQLSNRLQGAKFKLEKYKDGNWQQEGTEKTTNEKGTLTFSVSENDTLYRMTETEAPTGYLKSGEPYYFYITYDAQKDIGLPGDISKDLVHKLVVDGDSNTTQNFFYYCENAQNPEYVEDGNIKVVKVWKDSDGNVITDKSKMSDVTVTLTKHAPRMGHTIKVQAMQGDTPVGWISGIRDGATVYFASWGNETSLLSMTLPVGVTISREMSESSNFGNVYKMGPITSDFVITSSTLKYNAGVMIRQEGGDASQGKVDTVIGQIILNSGNRWIGEWNNLEIGDDITYTVTETHIDGYTTSYSVSGKDIAEGSEIPCKTSVTITNTSDEKSYILPETGGTGTNRFTAVGLSLMAASLMCEYVMRRKRRERRGN